MCIHAYIYGRLKATDCLAVHDAVSIYLPQGAIALVLWYGGKLVHLSVTTHGTQGISVGILTGELAEVVLFSHYLSKVVSQL